MVSSGRELFIPGRGQMYNVFSTSTRPSMRALFQSIQKRGNFISTGTLNDFSFLASKERAAFTHRREMGELHGFETSRENVFSTHTTLYLPKGFTWKRQVLQAQENKSPLG